MYKCICEHIKFKFFSSKNGFSTIDLMIINWRDFLLSPKESSKPMRKKDSDEYKSKVKPRTIFDKPEIVDMLGTALTLRWKPSSIPPYAVQTRIWYIVEQRIPPDTDWTKIATDLCDTEMRIKYSAANDYYFRVRAANEFGIAEPSMPVMLRKKEGMFRC